MKVFLVTVHKKGLHYALMGHNRTANFTTEIDLVRELKNSPFNVDLKEWSIKDQIANNEEFELVNIWGSIR